MRSMHASLAPEHYHETLMTAMVFEHGLIELGHAAMGLAVANTFSRMISSHTTQEALHQIAGSDNFHLCFL